MSVFVDTSAWYAAADRSDRANRRAKQILSGGHRLLTSDHVVVETWLLLRHRLAPAAAGRFWGALCAGAAVVETVSAADLEAAWHIADAFSDQGFSLVDCTSFAVMQRLGLRQAASFDDHFAVYRFGPGRRQSFEVLR